MKIAWIPFVCLVLAGCATMPKIVRGSSNYLGVGSVKSSLKGNGFYLAIGEVDLYRHRAFGGVAPLGRTRESAAGLQVDSATGRVERIVTFQPVAEQSATTTTSGNTVTTTVETNRHYVIGDLIGGISVIDIHPYPSWLDVLAAMRKATSDLGGSGNFEVVPQATVSTAVVVPPPFHWSPWRWRHFGHRRR